jgi:ribonuclease D
MPLEHLIFADDRTALDGALDALSDLDVVGVDVERADGLRYYRAAALLQIGGEGRVAVVDPLAVQDLSALHEFLVPRTVVVHALENDLPPLAVLDVVPTRVEDTAIAAALLGLPVGLETLLRELLGVELAADKQAMQRADWEERPLAEEMLRYAAADVADLPALWHELASRMAEVDRMSWYREELAATRSLPSVEERRDWTRTRGIGRLSGPARARVRALWEARERLAQESDTAPARVLPDKVLVELASQPPSALSELGRRGMRRASIRRFGEDIMAALSDAASASEESPRTGRRPAEQERATADRLRALRSRRARELGIEPGVLCPNRHLLGAVVADPATPAELRAALGLRSWQWDQLGDLFCEELGIAAAGKAAEQTDETTQEGPMGDVLNPDALHESLGKLDGWSGTVDQIAKTYTFADFAESMRFVNQVADLAEQANHHPDIHVSWNKVTLELVTHSAGGVTQNDIALAERIDGQPATAPGAP